jgi:thiol-disulfide isomerase/thioredoxin
MREYRCFSLALCLAATLLLESGCGNAGVPGRRPAPEISLAESLNSPANLTLAGSRGKVVLLEFWATWCPPCRASIPHLQKLHDAYGPRGLRIISVSAEEADTVRRFVTENRMTFPIGIDDANKTMTAYGIESIPAAVLIDPSGAILWRGHTMELKEEQIESALRNVKA